MFRRSDDTSANVSAKMVELKESRVYKSVQLREVCLERNAIVQFHVTRPIRTCQDVFAIRRIVPAPDLKDSIGVRLFIARRDCVPSAYRNLALAF